MADTKSEIKVTRTYSLDPVVIAWVTQKALRLSLKSDGQERTSDSKVVNDILREAMDKENATGNGEKLEKIAKAQIIGKGKTKGNNILDTQI